MSKRKVVTTYPPKPEHLSDLYDVQVMLADTRELSENYENLLSERQNLRSKAQRKATKAKESLDKIQELLKTARELSEETLSDDDYQQKIKSAIAELIDYETKFKADLEKAKEDLAKQDERIAALKVEADNIQQVTRELANTLEKLIGYEEALNHLLSLAKKKQLISYEKQIVGIATEGKFEFERTEKALNSLGCRVKSQSLPISEIWKSSILSEIFSDFDNENVVVFAAPIELYIIEWIQNQIEE